ncbi:hypothetical protein DL96DRAFT_525318 [Flagelloscypha sp. PMI_526]|nr:hypothetical protein DL96DRAFT_525318 [Flagelloscypha sp. PMI_526]
MDTIPASPSIDLPSEIWEIVFYELSDVDLWAVRSLNRVAYALAAQARYGALWIVPHRMNYLMTTMRRLCDDHLQITGLLHTLHVHSNIEFKESEKQERRTPHIPMARHRLIRKLLSRSDLNIKNLTIHFDTVVLPYVTLAWANTACALVHLELQFKTDSLLSVLLSSDSQLHCPNLKAFVLSYGFGIVRPSFRSIASMHLVRPWYASGSTIPMFRKLKAILPEGLERLELRNLENFNSDWILSPFFLGAHDFPHLRALHISNLSLNRNPSLGLFINARSRSLQSLALERVSDIGHVFLRHIHVAGELQTLSVSLNSPQDAFAADILPSNRSISLLHRYSHLRRLDITPLDSRYSDTNTVFVLLVEIGRRCSRLEELNVYSDTLGFRHLRAVLLFLQNLARLTFSGTKSCDPFMQKYSVHPELWNRLDSRNYKFSNLGLARQSLGRNVRREMAAELQRDVKSAYRYLSITPQSWDILHSSIKKALKEGYFMERPEASPDMEGDHRTLILELIERYMQQD